MNVTSWFPTVAADVFHSEIDFASSSYAIKVGSNPVTVSVTISPGRSSNNGKAYVKFEFPDPNSIY